MRSAAFTTLASSPVAGLSDFGVVELTEVDSTELVTSVLTDLTSSGAELFAGRVVFSAVPSDPAELAAELRFLVLAAVRRTGICFLQPKYEFADQ